MKKYNATQHRFRTNTGITIFKFIGLFVLFVIGSSQFAFAHGEVDEALVVINGDSIKTSDLNSMIINHHSSLSNSEKSDFDYRKLLNKLVNDKLILQEAYMLEMDTEPWLIEKLVEEKVKLSRQLYIKSNFKPIIKISEEEIIEYFNYYYFRMQLRTVSVESLELAYETIENIKNGLPMDSIAIELSMDSKKYQGGLHNLKFYADIERTFRDIAKELKIGEIAEPIPFRDVFVLFRLEDRVPPDTSVLDHLRKKINSVLRIQKQEEAWGTFVDSLTTLSSPTIHKNRITSIINDKDALFTENFVKGTDSIVIQIGDNHFITDSKFRNKISYTAMSNAQAPFDSLLELSLENLMLDLVFDYFAEIGKYEDSSYVIKSCQEIQDSALIEIYLQEIVVPQIKFNKSEFEKYYAEHIKDFQEKNRYQISEIQVSTKDSAYQIYSRLSEGTKFEFLQKQISSIEISNSNDWVTFDNFPASATRELDSLKIGGFCKPISMSSGWLIISITNKKAGRIKTFAESDMKIREIMFQIKFTELLDENLKQIKENSDIEYYDELIDKYFDN